MRLERIVKPNALKPSPVQSGPVVWPLAGGAELAGTLSISDATPTEGDQITFSWDGSGATSYQLYKDGVWVYGGDSLPYVRRVGVVDSGDYTIVASNGVDSITTDAVTLTVAANDLVSDDFTSGSPSGDWTSTNGTLDISGGKYNLNLTSLGAATNYLEKTLSNANFRIKFTIDTTNWASGNVQFLHLQGATHPIVQGSVINNTYARFAPNVNGFVYGCDHQFVRQPPNNVDFFAIGPTEIEFRWDASVGAFYVYADGVLVASGYGAQSGTYSPTAPTYVRIGKTSSTSGTGSYTIDDISIKEGNAASQPYTAKSRQAVVAVIGQSNAIGAAASSYNAVTDDIGDFIHITSGTVTDPENFIGKTTPTSTSVAFGMIQGIQLPAGFSPVIQNAGVGSTGFETDPGWADDATGLYRDRCTLTNAELPFIFEEFAPIAILFQGFESSTGSDPAAYKTKLASLIADVRTSLGGGNIPFVVGGFSPVYLSGGAAEDAGFIAIEAANQDYAENDDANGAFASSVSPSAATYQAGDPNWVHFDAAGYRTMGARHAAAYLTLNQAATP